MGHCVNCGARVQGRHPRQTSDALGAAASQIGPEALSLATLFNKELGIPFAKTAAVIPTGTIGKEKRGVRAIAKEAKSLSPRLFGSPSCYSWLFFLLRCLNRRSPKSSIGVVT